MADRRLSYVADTPVVSFTTEFTNFLWLYLVVVAVKVDLYSSCVLLLYYSVNKMIQSTET